jgi:uncharacterized protein YggE
MSIKRISSNMTSLVALAFVFAILATGCAGTDAAAKQTITVTGYGEAYAAPDIAIIQLGVNIVDDSLSAATSRSSTTIDKVQSALATLGVEAKDIQTSSYNIYPEDVVDPQSGIPTGERRYHVESTLSIKARDVTKLGEIIQAGLDAGANNIYGISFGLEDTSELEAQARTEAISDGAARAKQLTDGIGVKLGNPISINETGGYGGGPIYVEYSAKVGGMGGGGAVPISPGQTTVTVQVTITYEITP